MWRKVLFRLGLVTVAECERREQVAAESNLARGYEAGYANGYVACYQIGYDHGYEDGLAVLGTTFGSYHA